MKPPRCEPRGFSFEIRAALQSGGVICNCRRRIGGLSRVWRYQARCGKGGANGTRLTVDAVSLDSLLGMTGVRAERRITFDNDAGLRAVW